MHRDFEPVCSTNTIEDAEIIVAWFETQGLAAHVKDSFMVANFTWGAPAVAPHGVEVVVAPGDLDRAKELWNARTEELHPPQPVDGPPIEALCEECDHRATFPFALRGKVESCPHCGAYLDIPDPSHVDAGDDE